MRYTKWKSCKQLPQELFNYKIKNKALKKKYFPMENNSPQEKRIKSSISSRFQLFKRLHHAYGYFLPLKQPGLSQVIPHKCPWSKMASVSRSGHNIDTLHYFATYRQTNINFLFMLKQKQVSLTQVTNYSLLCFTPCGFKPSSNKQSLGNGLLA